MSTESLVAAAQKALEAAQSDRAEAKAAEARARAIADSADAKARKAEGEAEYQLTGKDPTAPGRPPNPKKGKGPLYNTAKANAEAARREADAARAKAITAKSNADSADERAKAAEGRMAKFNAEIEGRKEADAYRRRTLTAVGAGVGITAVISGTQKVLEGKAGRQATRLLQRDMGENWLANKLGTNKGQLGVEATLRAMEKAGTGKPLTWRGLAGKATVPLGAAAALVGTSTYLKGEAEKYRKAGQKDIASAIDTFALAERYAAVGLVAEGTVGTAYDALKKVGKPTMNVAQLHVVERAKAVVGIAEPLAKQAVEVAAKVGPKVGSAGAYKEAAKLIGVTKAGRSQAAVARAIVEAAAKVAEPATKTVGSLSKLAPTIRQGIRSVAARAFTPLLVGAAAVAALNTRAEAKEGGATEAQATTKGAARFADDLMLNAPSTIARAARTQEARGRRASFVRQLRQPGGYAAAAARRVLSNSGRKAQGNERSDGIVDAHFTTVQTTHGTKQVYVKARVMTAKERNPRRKR